MTKKFKKIYKSKATWFPKKVMANEQHADPKLTHGPEMRYYLKIHNFYRIFLKLGQNDQLIRWSF